MKNLISSSIVIATLSLVSVVPSFASETDAGLVDFGRLVPSPHGQFVELNLSQGMLKFAAKIASCQDSDAGDLIGNLRQIRINVVGMDDSNRADTVGKMRALSHRLESEGWTQVATSTGMNRSVWERGALAWFPLPTSRRGEGAGFHVGPAPSPR